MALLDEVRRQQLLDPDIAPLLDEVRRQQLLDPDIAPLFKYHENNKDKSDLSGSKYHREAPITLGDNGILYYRTLIGDDDTLAHAQLLPDSLVPTVLRALHDSNNYGPPGFKATYSIVRERAYWKGMYKRIKQYLKNVQEDQAVPEEL
jgi:hypothetical protein